MKCALVLASLNAIAAGWIAVGPVVNNAVDVFEVGNNGAKGKDVLTIPLAPGETTSANSFTCGRCFCLLLTQNEAAKKSTLYNMSFCLVPVPAVESNVSINSLTTNLHSNLGEGDGGDGYTIMVDRSTTPQKFAVATIVGAALRTLVDISAYVNTGNGVQGTIWPGGTAYCSSTHTLWVAIDAPGGDKDSLITVNLATGLVTSALTLDSPVPASMFANCKTSTPGGVILQSSGPGRHAVVIGEINAATGAWTALDAADLPAGSNLDVTPIVDVVETAQFTSAYGAVLTTPGNAMPGTLFVSTAASGGARGSATLSPLGAIVTAVAVEY